MCPSVASNISHNRFVSLSLSTQILCSVLPVREVPLMLLWAVLTGMNCVSIVSSLAPGSLEGRHPSSPLISIPLPQPPFHCIVVPFERPRNKEWIVSP